MLIDSFKHRAEVRARLDCDVEWQSNYLSPALICFMQMENSSMYMPSWCVEFKRVNCQPKGKTCCSTTVNQLKAVRYVELVCLY